MAEYRYFLFDTGAPARAQPDGQGGYESVEVWRAGLFVAASGKVPVLLLKTGATEITEARFNALCAGAGQGA